MQNGTGKLGQYLQLLTSLKLAIVETASFIGLVILIALALIHEVSSFKAAASPPLVHANSCNAAPP
ncbi:MAG: hypothetical protein ACJ72H_16165 [Candidatus Sulfotelmatobacter sp.]